MVKVVQPFELKSRGGRIPRHQSHIFAPHHRPGMYFKMTVQAVHSRKMSEDLSREHAKTLDQNDSLKHFREEFIIPTKADLKRKTLVKPCR